MLFLSYRVAFPCFFILDILILSYLFLSYPILAGTREWYLELLSDRHSLVRLILTCIFSNLILSYPILSSQ